MFCISTTWGGLSITYHTFRDLLQLFVTAELIKWSGLCEVYEKELRSDATNVFPNNEDGNDRWTKLKDRVVEHVS